MILAIVHLYDGRDGRNLGKLSCEVKSPHELADVVMGQYALRNECIIDFPGGNHITTTLARMDYLRDHYDVKSARFELLTAIERKLANE